MGIKFFVRNTFCVNKISIFNEEINLDAWRGK